MDKLNGQLGGYWTSIQKKYGGGWELRHRHSTIEKATQYAESMNMLTEGRVVIMLEVAEVHYSAFKAD